MVHDEAPLKTVPPSADDQAPVKIGLIAGGGALPLRLAEACQLSGRPFHVIALEGLADKAVENYPHSWAALGTVGHTLSILKDQGCGAICMSGIVRRPDFSALKLDLVGTRLLPRALMAARGGDDKLLRFLVDVFEERGFRVEGPDQVMGALVASEGPLGRHEPDAQALEDLDLAWRVATRLGEFDIAQGAVVVRGLVLAVEAAEGTDAMLNRCRDLPATLKGTAEARAGVLVKRPKPDQERRIDLPTIGVRTVEGASAIGLAGIGIASGETLVMDREAVIRAADEMGLFVIGLTGPEIRS